MKCSQSVENMLISLGSKGYYNAIAKMYPNSLFYLFIGILVMCTAFVSGFPIEIDTQIKQAYDMYRNFLNYKNS